MSSSNKLRWSNKDFSHYIFKLHLHERKALLKKNGIQQFRLISFQEFILSSAVPHLLLNSTNSLKRSPVRTNFIFAFWLTFLQEIICFLIVPQFRPHPVYFLIHPTPRWLVITTNNVSTHGQTLTSTTHIVCNTHSWLILKASFGCTSKQANLITK